MAMIPVQELIIMGPKLVEAMFFISIAFIVKNRGGHTFKEQYYLNRTFFFAFLSWFVYIISDAFLFPFAALSFEGVSVTTKTTFTGYPLEYPSLFIANVLRDVAMAGGILNLVFIFIGAYQIRFGRAKCQKEITHNVLAFVLILLFIGATVFFDGIKVSIYPIADGKDPSVNPVYDLPQIILLFSTIVLYFISAISLRKSMSIGMSEKEQPLQRRLRLLSVGVLLMGVGHLYWVFKGIFGLLPGIGPFITTNAIALLLIGHAIWTLSPILMYFALRKTENDEALKEMVKTTQ